MVEGRISGAGLTSLAQVASEGRAAPTGSVEKWLGRLVADVAAPGLDGTLDAVLGVEVAAAEEGADLAELLQPAARTAAVASATPTIARFLTAVPSSGEKLRRQPRPVIRKRAPFRQKLGRSGAATCTRPDDRRG